jgi:hypothetical protein
MLTDLTANCYHNWANSLTVAFQNTDDGTTMNRTPIALFALIFTIFNLPFNHHNNHNHNERCFIVFILFIEGVSTSYNELEEEMYGNWYVQFVLFIGRMIGWIGRVQLFSRKKNIRIRLRIGTLCRPVMIR